MVISKCVIIKIVVIIIFCIIVVGTRYMFVYALKSDPSSRDISASYAYLRERSPLLGEWVDSVKSEGLLRDTFVRYDNLQLHALYIKSPIDSDKTAVLIHGYTDNAVRMLMIAQLYSKELGYNVIIPDLSGHGESGGEWIHMGWKYRHEVMMWIDVARELFGDGTKMVIHGISMGAATTMMVSGEKLPDNVKCFVEDCGYTDVWSQFKYELWKSFSIPAFPLMYTTSIYCKSRLGWNFKEASAIRQVEKCTKPMFFIHGGSDTYVPTYMVKELYDAKKSGAKELWIPEGVKHADAYWDYPQEYTKRVSDFVNKYL